MEDNDFVSIWLEESGNPAIEELSRENRELADKVKSILSEKGLDSADLSDRLDINHDEITRWLTGLHTFSMKTLTAISVVLIDLRI